MVGGNARSLCYSTLSLQSMCNPRGVTPIVREVALSLVEQGGRVRVSQESREDIGVYA